MAQYAPNKNLSFLAAGALAIGCAVGWGAFIMPGTTFLPKAGPVGTAIALTIGATLMAIIAINYRYLMAKLPVNGGSFAFTQKAFGRLHSYVCGWSLAIAYLVIIPSNATVLSILVDALEFSALKQGPMYSIAGYDNYLPELVVIAAVLGALALLAAYGGEKAFKVEVAFVVCLAVGLTATFIAVLVVPSAPIVHLSPAFHPNVDPLVGVLATVAIAPWIFIGFGSVSQMAGEFNFSPAKAGWLVILALTAAAFAYLALNTLATVVPSGYESWDAYVDASAHLPGMHGFPLFLAMNQLMGPAGSFLLGFTLLAAALSGILGFYLVSSRLLASMARGGVLSDWFGELSWPKRRPLHAMLFLFLASLLLVCFGQTALGWIVSMSSAGATIAFLYTCASTRKFARQEGNRAMTALATAGIIATGLFLFVLIAPIPQLGVSLSQESYLFVVAWVALGINFYTPEVPHFDPETEQIETIELPPLTD